MAIEPWNGTQEQANNLWEASRLLDQAADFIARAKSLLGDTVNDMEEGDNCGRDTYYHADDIQGMSEWGCSDDVAELSRHLESVAGSVVVFDPDAADDDDTTNEDEDDEEEEAA